MTQDELKLAKECGLADEDGDCYHPIRAELETFYRAAFNAGLEAAAKRVKAMTCDYCSDAIRKLEMKP